MSTCEWIVEATTAGEAVIRDPSSGAELWVHPGGGATFVDAQKRATMLEVACIEELLRVARATGVIGDCGQGELSELERARQEVLRVWREVAPTFGPLQPLLTALHNWSMLELPEGSEDDS